MEYVEGKPVAPVEDLRELLDIATQMADGLQAAHAAGFLHRDLKPGQHSDGRETRLMAELGPMTASTGLAGLPVLRKHKGRVEKPV